MKELFLDVIVNVNSLRQYEHSVQPKCESNKRLHNEGISEFGYLGVLLVIHSIHSTRLLCFRVYII